MAETGDDRAGEEAVYAPPVPGTEGPIAPNESGKKPPKTAHDPVPRTSLFVRTLVTAGAAAIAWGLGKVPLPGLDVEAIRAEHGIEMSQNMSVVALGLLPVISAAALVELGALAVPPWRRLRHAGPPGRAKINGAIAALALLLAGFQAWGLTRALATFPSSSSVSPILGAATLTAGTFLLWGLAGAVSRWGLGNGVVWLYWCLLLLGEIKRYSAPFVGPDAVGGPVVTELNPTLGALAGLVCVVTSVLVLRSSRGQRNVPVAKGQEAAPSRLSLPLPASGLAAMSLAPRIFSNIPSLLWGVGVTTMEPLSARTPTGMLVYLVGTAGFAIGLTYLFHRRSQVDGVLSRLRIDGADKGGSFGRALVRGALLPTVASQIALMLCAVLLPNGALAIPMLVAFVLDAIDAHRARREGEWVTVWTEERPFAAMAARAALARNGITLYTDGLLARAFLQWGAGYAPIRLQVRANEAARAARYLAEALPDAAAQVESRVETPAEASAKPKKGSKKRPLEASTAVLGRAPTLVTGTLFAAAIAGFIVVANWLAPPVRPAAPPTVEEIGRRRAALQIVLVDDEHDPMEKIATETSTPVGVRFERENAPLGLGKTAPVYYALAVRAEGESVAALTDRIKPWLDKIQVPAGTHFGLQEQTEMDETSGVTSVVALRTMLLHDEVVVTGADVVDAIAMPEKSPQAADGWKVTVELSKSAGEYFADVTGANIKRRMAIVSYGRVMSAPVIQSRIAGGRLVITMGQGDPNEQKQQAIALEKALRAVPRGPESK